MPAPPSCVGDPCMLPRLPSFGVDKGAGFFICGRISDAAGLRSRIFSYECLCRCCEFLFSFLSMEIIPARWRDSVQATTSSAVRSRREVLQATAFNQGGGGTTPWPALCFFTRTRRGVVLAGAQLSQFVKDLYKHDQNMASSRGTRDTHNTTTTLLNSEGARGQHRCNTRLGGWTQIIIKERNSVLSCAS